MRHKLDYIGRGAGTEFEFVTLPEVVLEHVDFYLQAVFGAVQEVTGRAVLVGRGDLERAGLTIDVSDSTVVNGELTRVWQKRLDEDPTITRAREANSARRQYPCGARFGCGRAQGPVN